MQEEGQAAPVRKHQVGHALALAMNIDHRRCGLLHGYAAFERVVPATERETALRPSRAELRGPFFEGNIVPRAPGSPVILDPGAAG